jgi:hypothetical protein
MYMLQGSCLSTGAGLNDGGFIVEVVCAPAQLATNFTFGVSRCPSPVLHSLDKVHILSSSKSLVMTVNTALPAEAHSLARAIRVLPDNPMVTYVYGPVASMSDRLITKVQYWLHASSVCASL